jgi:hypothetical protein
MAGLGYEDQGERPMAWTTPTLVEIIGLEINGYLPAQFREC